MRSPRSLLRPLLVASVLALPLTSFAQPDAEHCGGDPLAAPLPPHLHGLPLSEAQQDKIFSLIHAQAPKLREQAKTARKSREELHALARSAAFDDGKAKALAEIGAKANAESALILARLDQQTMKLLTPEQRKQLDERMSPHPSPAPAR